MDYDDKGLLIASIDYNEPLFAEGQTMSRSRFKIEESNIVNLKRSHGG